MREVCPVLIDSPKQIALNGAGALDVTREDFPRVESGAPCLFFSPFLPYSLL